MLRTGYTRPNGPKHSDPDFKEIRPSNPLYKKLLSYRYYRLLKTTSKRTGRETAKTRDHIKRMEITLKDYSFDGQDPIKVLEFLSKFCDEADTLEMTEAQAYVVLPYLLKGSAKEQFNAVKGTLAGDGGVTSWPEAVQYLLRSYATNGAIREATIALRDTKQPEDETEVQFDTRLNKAFHRCGNVHGRDDRMAYFVDGLTPAIKELVARHREANSRCTYLDLVTFAKAEGEAYRARLPQRNRSILDSRTRQEKMRSNAKTRGNAMLLQSSADSREDTLQEVDGDGNMYLLNEELISANTSDLPTDTIYSQEGTEAETLAYVGRQVAAPHVPYGTRGMARSRPGWQDPKTFARQATYPPRDPKLFICYCCYGRGHTANQCLHPMRDRRTVITNYDALTDAEKGSVPTESYQRAKIFMDGEGIVPEVPLDGQKPSEAKN